MKQKINIGFFLVVILPLLLSSCVERYWPDVGNKFENLLVVDGMITSSPGPYAIGLSLSSPLGYDQQTPYQNCELHISDNTGTSEILSEIEPGQYVTTNPNFQGVVGRQYKLTIFTPDEKTYESSFQELKEAVEIDTVYANLEYRHSPETSYDLTGFQFYISSAMATKDTNYFVWSLEQTYKFNANYRARYMFDGEMHNVTHPAFNYTCWKTNSVAQIFTYNTSRLSTALIQDFPLHYVSTETKELSIKYSLLVKQFTLSKEAYNYWYSVQKQVEDKGSLYERQPYQIRGNMSNVNNPEEPVLGFFMVAGSAEKRIFVDKPTGVKFHYSKTCGMTIEDLYNMLYLMRADWPVYLTIAYDDEGGGGATALPNRQSCVDCREAGGSIEKPEFWED